MFTSKRNGSWQKCVDYRTLYAVTIKNMLPDMGDLFDQLKELNGAKVFSKSDLRSSYNQICVRLQDTK
jgi:hypothetical protein